MRKQQHLNREYSTSIGTLAVGGVSLTVADGSVFPAEGDYTVAIENEIVLVTARATNVLTIVRGVEGTTAVEHATGNYVFPLITSAGINKWASSAILPAQQTLVIPDRIQTSAGVVLTKTDFTESDMSSSTVSDITWGGINIAARIEIFVGTYIRQLTRPEPSTPYTVTAHVMGGAGCGFSSDYKRGQMTGIGWKDSGTGELITCGMRMDKEVVWNEHAAWNTATPTINHSTPFRGRYDCWMRLTNDGATLTMEVSYDGFNFFTLGSEAVGTFITPDQIFFFTHNGLTSGPKRIGRLLGWYED